MANKQNCWEYKKCNRQPGGSKTGELGVCPAATDNKSDGKNDGDKAGRYCWRIAGTLCDGEVAGTYACKMKFCSTCDFFKEVERIVGK